MCFPSSQITIYQGNMWPKVLPHVKKSLYNQPKPYFFQKIIVKSFLDIF
jgi:hypothetical protein